MKRRSFTKRLLAGLGLGAVGFSEAKKLTDNKDLGLSEKGVYTQPVSKDTLEVTTKTSKNFPVTCELHLGDLVISDVSNRGNLLEFYIMPDYQLEKDLKDRFYNNWKAEIVQNNIMISCVLTSISINTTAYESLLVEISYQTIYSYENI